MDLGELWLGMGCGCLEVDWRWCVNLTRFSLVMRGLQYTHVGSWVRKDMNAVLTALMGRDDVRGLEGKGRSNGGGDRPLTAIAEKHELRTPLTSVIVQW